MSLVLNNVRKKFGNMVAVDGISIEMENGLYGLLGTNGAGKTTLMRILCTVLKPSDGKIYYNGEDIFEMDGRYRNIIGYLPQEFGFYPNLSVKDYLSYIASLKGLNKRLTKVRIEKLLEITGMQIHSSKKMKKLSGGMKRRVGIAQALLNDPKILILDEPTAGLDVEGRNSIHQEIKRLKTQGKTILLASHDMTEVEELCDRIGVLNHGKIVFIGAPDQLHQTMQSKFKLKVRFSKVPRLNEQFEIVSQEQEYYIFETTNLEITLKAIIQLTEEQSIKIMEINTVQPKLEERFLKEVQS